MVWRRLGHLVFEPIRHLYPSPCHPLADDGGGGMIRVGKARRNLLETLNVGSFCSSLATRPAAATRRTHTPQQWPDSRRCGGWANSRYPPRRAGPGMAAAGARADDPDPYRRQCRDRDRRQHHFEKDVIPPSRGPIRRRTVIYTGTCTEADTGMKT